MTRTDFALFTAMPADILSRLHRLPYYCRTVEEWLLQTATVEQRTTMAKDLGVSLAWLTSHVRDARELVLSRNAHSMVFEGDLEGYFGQETEGVVVWTLTRTQPSPHDWMAIIEDFDHLRVVDHDGVVLCDEEIHLVYDVALVPHPFRPDCFIQRAMGTAVRGVQRGWEPDTWAGLFLQYHSEPERLAYRATLTKNPPRFDV